MFRRISIYRAATLILAGLLAGCGQAAGTGSSGASTPAAPAGNVEPVFAFSEAVAGRNRIAIGLVRNNTPLNDPNAKVHLRFFNLDETNPQPKFETDATYYGQGLPAAFYVAYPTFDKAWQLGRRDPDAAARPGAAEPAQTARGQGRSDVPNRRPAGDLRQDADRQRSAYSRSSPRAQTPTRRCTRSAWTRRSRSRQADRAAVRHAGLLQDRHLRPEP